MNGADDSRLSIAISRHQYGMSLVSNSISGGFLGLLLYFLIFVVGLVLVLLLEPIA